MKVYKLESGRYIVAEYDGNGYISPFTPKRKKVTGYDAAVGATLEGCGHYAEHFTLLSAYVWLHHTDKDQVIENVIEKLRTYTAPVR